MQKKEQGVSCTQRCGANYLALVFNVPFFLFWVWMCIRFRNELTFIPLAVTLIWGLFDLHLIMEILNRKIVMIEDKLMVYNFMGIKKEYNICNISQVVVWNKYRKKSMLLLVDKSKINIQAPAKGYEEFRKQLCEKLQIKELDYLKRGKHKFDL